MTKVVILGTGNVARHLFNALREPDHLNVIQVVGRNKKALSYFNRWSDTTSDFNLICEADIYIIAIADDAIHSIFDTIAIKNKFVVHTSGSVAIDALPRIHRRGVFYPLQTFSENREINFKNMPICIEAENKEDLKILHQLAASISDMVFEVSSEQRKSLHLAAVFVNNFTNHLYAIGNKICLENKIPFAILEPLIQETSRKIKTISPYEAQTGPAQRFDKGTIEKHITLLKNKKHRDIYSLLSQSIQEIYTKEREKS